MSLLSSTTLYSQDYVPLANDNGKHIGFYRDNSRHVRGVYTMDYELAFET